MLSRRAIRMSPPRLRQKVDDDSRHLRLLKTIRGAGYVFAAEPGQCHMGIAADRRDLSDTRTQKFRANSDGPYDMLLVTGNEGRMCATKVDSGTVKFLV